MDGGPYMGSPSLMASEGLGWRVRCTLVCIPVVLLFGCGGLHSAIKKGDGQEALRLIEAGEGLEDRGDGGELPIHAAARLGQHEVVEALVAAGQDVDARADGEWTPLMRACQRNHMYTARFLLDQGANVHFTNYQGHSALHLAAHEKHRDMVGLLLAEDANVHARTRDGQTPLHCAAAGGALGVTMALVDAGAMVCARTPEGQTPLDSAAENDHRPVAWFLIEQGAKPHLFEDPTVTAGKAYRMAAEYYERRGYLKLSICAYKIAAREFDACAAHNANLSEHYAQKTRKIAAQNMVMLPLGITISVLSCGILRPPSFQSTAPVRDKKFTCARTATRCRRWAAQCRRKVASVEKQPMAGR